jgi:hypothetical protein
MSHGTSAPTFSKAAGEGDKLSLRTGHMKLTSPLEAIEQVFGKGYFPECFKIPLNAKYQYWIDDNGCHFSIQEVEQMPCVTFTQVCLDSLFWRALSKTRGWSERIIMTKCADNVEVREWLMHALDYFETRLSGGDETKFWESLP